MARCFLLALPESLKWSGIHKSHKSNGFTKSASTRISKASFSMACCLCIKKSFNDKILHSSSLNSNLLSQQGSEKINVKESVLRHQSEFHGFIKSASVRIGKASFSTACCLCGKKSLNDKILHSSSLESNLLIQQGSEEMNVKESVPRHQSWSQDGRQLLDSIKRRWPWTEKEALAQEAYSKAPKWRKLLRKLRAKTRKISCITRSPGFNYDPLSYAMNFDEGCWKSDIHGEGYLHSMRFSAPMILESDFLTERKGPTENMPLKISLPLSHPSSLSLWQRRKTSKPPALDLERLPTWSSARPKL